MNDLEQKIHDIIQTLEVKLQEVKSVQSKRQALENSQLVASKREERLNDLQIDLGKREADVASQKKYIDGEVEKNTRLLAGITKEKELLEITAEAKQKHDKDVAYIEVREKALADKTLEFEKDKALFKKQDDAVKEYQSLLTAREKRIKAREESLDNIERKLAI